VGYVAVIALATAGGATALGLGRISTGHQYNPAAETTVKGTVEQVQQSGSGAGWTATHLRLKTESGIVDVRLGPSSFLTEKNFTISKGDQIEVTGSEMNYNGAEVLVAREVRKGNQVLMLRNKNGVPLWSRKSRPAMGQNQGGQGMGSGAMRPSDPPSASVAAGKKIFEQDCSSCHYAHRTTRKVGPGLKGLFQKAKLPNGDKMTTENVREWIDTGHRGMPAMPPFQNKLDKQQINNLIAYLKTL
jgi:mono/diheme cytochrome c family protein